LSFLMFKFSIFNVLEMRNVKNYQEHVVWKQNIYIRNMDNQDKEGKKTWQLFV